MNGFHKLFRLVVAISFASFAVPALAIDKHYSLFVQASSPSADGGVPIKLVLKNESPPGTANSNIGSFAVTVVGATIAPGSITTCEAGTCSVTGNTLTVKKISALQAQQTLEVDFSTTSCGDGHWFATVYNGSQLSGQTFSLVDDPGFAAVPEDQITNVSCGTAACNTTFVVADSRSPSTTDSQYVTGSRSPLNKDGTCTATTDYFVSNMLPSNGRLHFRWPVDIVDGQPSAVFRYTVNLPSSTAMVAWLNTDGTPATDSDPSVFPSFIPAPACLTALAPAPYAQLGSAISATTNPITVVNSLPPGQLPSRPFPAVIGSERILDQQVAGNGTWTVLRGQGGTAAASHSGTDPVMGTPLPILPAPIGPYFSSADPTQPVQAQVCIIGAPVKNSGGNWTATFFDIGDAWTGIR